MTADRLIRLYPRPWRDRYGAEFLETIGPNALHVQQVIDIAMGAVDAWVSAEVRRSTTDPVVSNSGGRPMPAMLKTACRDSQVRYTTRDMLISAVVLVGVSVVLTLLGIAIDRSGRSLMGPALKNLAFPVAVLVSMPFGILKGQPWRAQAVVLGVTFVILVGIALI